MIEPLVLTCWFAITIMGLSLPSPHAGPLEGCLGVLLPTLGWAFSMGELVADPVCSGLLYTGDLRFWPPGLIGRAPRCVTPGHVG